MTKDHYHIDRYSTSFRPAARAAGTGACLLAKIGFDTAENEPCKVCPLSVYGSPRFVLLEAKDLMPANVLVEDVQELAMAATTLLMRQGKPNAW